jgi:hypothetical protein
MSALPPKADIGTQSRDVRFVPKADSCTAAKRWRLRAFAPDFLHNLKISYHTRIAAHAARFRQREIGP